MDSIRLPVHPEYPTKPWRSMGVSKDAAGTHHEPTLV